MHCLNQLHEGIPTFLYTDIVLVDRVSKICVFACCVGHSSAHHTSVMTSDRVGCVRCLGELDELLDATPALADSLHQVRRSVALVPAKRRAFEDVFHVSCGRAHVVFGFLVVVADQYLG